MDSDPAFSPLVFETSDAFSSLYTTKKQANNDDYKDTKENQPTYKLGLTSAYIIANGLFNRVLDPIDTSKERTTTSFCQASNCRSKFSCKANRFQASNGVKHYKTAHPAVKCTLEDESNPEKIHCK